MAARASNASEFRQILTRLKEVQDKLERSDQASLASKLSDINDSLSIIEGNQTDFSDSVLQTLERIETTMVNGFKAMEDRISSLEAYTHVNRNFTSENNLYVSGMWTEINLCMPYSFHKLASMSPDCSYLGQLVIIRDIVKSFLTCTDHIHLIA